MTADTMMRESGPTAIIADDDEFFRMALKTVLTRLGFDQVIEACSLDEAVERLSETEAVDLAVFDLAMPGMESAASLRAVRECYPDTRVAVVSASQSRTDILLALAAGAHGYVPKGLGIAELSRALQSITAGTIYIPPLITDLSNAGSEPNRPLGDPAFEKAEPSRTFTPRQRQVLDYVVQGHSNKHIARTLNLGEGTVKVHVAALFRTLGVTTRSAAAAAGARLASPKAGAP